MKKSRSYYFKYSTFLGNVNLQTVKSANSLANRLLNKNDKHFWQEIKMTNSSGRSVANTVNNVTHINNVLLCAKMRNYSTHHMIICKGCFLVSV